MIEFLEEEHTYLVDGVIVPSVTQILSNVFPHKYEGIPTKILNRKAEYGTKVHKLIEILETKNPKKPIGYLKRYYGLDTYQEISIEQYLKLKEKYNIEILENEKQVAYKNLYAGTLDIKAKVNGKLAIIDIKTTSELDEDYVSWQTSYYELADEPVEELYVLWLPKGKMGKLIKVARVPKDKLLNFV